MALAGQWREAYAHRLSIHGRDGEQLIADKALRTWALREQTRLSATAS
ncbi:MAG: hypothetical protein N2512_14890 [Armatimonadetes bacterium]|nr:hypothetical protein [Armatimonadota bacterium]